MAGVVLCDIAACFIKVILRDRRNIFARLLEFYGQIEWQAWENREGVILRGRGSIWCRCRHSLWETLRFTLYTPNSTLYITLHFTLYTLHFRLFPHIFVWGSCFWLCTPAPPAPPPTHNLSTHDLSTHNLSTHNLLTHNLLTHNLLTHNLSTHNLHTTCQHTTYSHTTCQHTTYSHTTCQHTTYSHTTCPHTTYSHTITHTPLVHTQLVNTQLANTQLTSTHTHSRLAHPQLAHTQLVHTQLTHTHTQLVHTPLTPGTYGTGLALVARLVPSGRRCRRGCLRDRRGTWRHGRAFCVAGVALGDIDLHFAWHLRHLWHWAGSGGALGSQWTPLSPWLFAWQAWHLAASTCILRGRRGTWRHRRAFCVAGVALCGIDVHSAWQAWHLRHWAGSGGALGSQSRGCLRGRRGAWRYRPPLCVAGLALGDIDVHSAWQAWHLATSTCILRGRRGAWRHRRAFCVAGAALTALGWLWWRTWFPRRCRRGCLRGRRGTRRHRRALGVAGVALCDIDVRSAWQVWHLMTSTCILCGRCELTALGWLWWRAWFPVDAVVAAAVCVAGVALGDIDVHSAWQAWHLATSTCILRGGRGAW